jgi:hypothetical protein
VAFFRGQIQSQGQVPVHLIPDPSRGTRMP